MVEYGFVGFYAFEILVRYLSFRRTVFALLDPWFVFDFVLVLVMVAEYVVRPSCDQLPSAASSGKSFDGYGNEGASVTWK